LRRTGLRQQGALGILAVNCAFGLATVGLFAQQPGPPRPAHVAVPSAVPSPVIDATSLGAPILLKQGWRVGLSADPAAASPGFDDSSWAIRDAQPTIEEVAEPSDSQNNPQSRPHPQGAGPVNLPGLGNGLMQGNVRRPDNGQRPGPQNPGGNRRYAWFRMHLTLAPNHGPIALLIEVPVSRGLTLGITQPGTSVDTGPGVDVFANGKQIQPDGPHSDNPHPYEQISRIYNLNVAAAETSLTLVVRTLDIPFGFDSYTYFFAGHTLRLGDANDLQQHLAIWSMHNFLQRLPRMVYSLLLLILAGFLLVLFRAQKGHPEYLWLALHELVQAPGAFLELAGSTGWVDKLWYAALVLQLIAASSYLFFEFLVAFLSLPRRWYIRLLRYTAPVLAFIAPMLLLVARRGNVKFDVLLVVVLVCSLCWMAGWVVFVFGTLIRATLRRNFEAGLLLIPLVLGLVGSVEPTLTASVSAFTGHPIRPLLTFMAGPIPIHFASIADFTGILAIVIIIFGRFLRIQRDREHAINELAAARSVQELMIPSEKLATPGFEVESIYDPASEVGGDFFHVQMSADGGMIVVIGDVAGKGLKAAMTVSMLMGVLRATKDSSPAKILKSLNTVLTGSDSFTTCLAAWFSADGSVLLANAGHLPPYLNSLEVSLPGGLPLGVVPEVNYEEVSLSLHPGDRLLLLSDGVVEARKPSGELFGFERLQNLSNQSVFYIADAAKSFGQDDDITVLTVRRLARTMAA